MVLSQPLRSRAGHVLPPSRYSVALVLEITWSVSWTAVNSADLKCWLVHEAASLVGVVGATGAPSIGGKRPHRHGPRRYLRRPRRERCRTCPNGSGSADGELVGLDRARRGHGGWVVERDGCGCL